MVVGLGNFIDQKAPQCYAKTSLADLSKTLLQANPSKEGKVNVLIDGMSFIYFAYYRVGKLGICYDTEWIGLRNAIYYSVEELRSYDFNPIFFFKGEYAESIVDSSTDTFYSKLSLKKKRAYTLTTLKTFRQNMLKPVEEMKFKGGSFQINMAHEQMLLKDLGCQVRTGGAKRNAMAVYAKDATNRIAAVFSDSTDFFVYDLPCASFLLRAIDFKQATAERFDRQELLRRLGLQFEALPILAALLDERTRDMKDPVRQLLVDHGLTMPCYPYLDFEKVAQFAGQLQQNPIKLQKVAEELPANYLSTALELFSLKVPEAELEANLITAENEWDDILKFAKRKMSESQIFKDIYSLLHHSQYYGRVGLEDYEEKLVPLTDEILGSVRRRLYGFVFREKPPLSNGTDLQVHEYYIGYGPEVAFTKTTSPSPLPGEHPPLSVLWKVPANKSNQDWQQRWGLLLAILLPDIWREESKLDRILAVLTDMDGRFIMVVLTVLFLQRGTEEAILSDKEMDAFLSQVVLLSRELTANPQLNDFKYGVLNMRCVHLAALFVSVASYVAFLVAIVGYPIPWEETMPWRYYDGKVFAYSLARGTSSLNDVQSKRIVSKMKSAIQIGLENYTQYAQ